MVEARMVDGASPHSSALAPTQQVQPRELASRTEVPIVDIRPRSERDGELGFIPSSRSMPAESLTADPNGLERVYPGAECVVLACLTGRRSRQMVASLAPLASIGVAHLEGGLLAWQAAGLPLCGIRGVSLDELVRLERVEDFPRAVLSCFAAESVENQLRSGQDELDDPRRLVESVFDGLVDGRPEQLEVCLDELAAAARRMGHSLVSIAENVDRMRASLRHVCRASPESRIV